MDNLVLVGFSCSGKTTVSRILARRLRLRFVDTDRLVEEATGRTIPEIFAADGEPAFREMEREVVTRVCAERLQVISTGGGAFEDPASRELLRKDNLVVHLRVRAETVVERLRGSRSGRSRPLLETSDPLKRVRELMEARQPAYSQAHISLDADDRTTFEVAADIGRRWQAWWRVTHGTPAPMAARGSR